MQRSKDRKKTRLESWDYSIEGYYFVTICVQNFQKCLGKVVEDKMVLNKFGEIVKKQLLELTKHYISCAIDEWVIMPNHLHAIIILNSNVGEGLKPSPTNKNYKLTEIVRGLKTFSSKQIHQLGFDKFRWQRSFYDHIIRNEISFEKIRHYIRHNPIKWHLDEYNR